MWNYLNGVQGIHGVMVWSHWAKVTSNNEQMNLLYGYLPHSFINEKPVNNQIIITNSYFTTLHYYISALVIGPIT